MSGCFIVFLSSDSRDQFNEEMTESLLPVMCQDYYQKKPIPGPWAPAVSSTWPLDKSLGPHAGLDSLPDSASFRTTRPVGHLRLVQTPAIGQRTPACAVVLMSRRHPQSFRQPPRHLSDHSCGPFYRGRG